MRKKLPLPSIMAALLATAVTAQASLIQWLTTTNVSSVQTNANGWVTNWLDSSGSANHTANAGVVVGTNLYPSSSLSASGKPGVDLGLGRNGFRLWSIAAQDTWLDFTQAGPSGAQGKSGFAVLVAFKVDSDATNTTIQNTVIASQGNPAANPSFVLKYNTGYPACYIGNSGSNPQYIHP